MKFLLLGCFALIQSWIDSSAGVHQAAVAVVLVRFNSTNIELPISAIITVLQRKNTNYYYI